MLTQLTVIARAVATSSVALLSAFLATESPTLSIILQSQVDCPQGQIVVIDSSQICVVYENGLIPEHSLEVSLSTSHGGGGATEPWCVRHNNEAGSSRINPWRVHCNAGDWWFSVEWDCYLRLDESVQPTGSMPRRDVPDEGGRVFEIRCYPPQETVTGLMYMNGFGEWQASQFIVGPENPPGYGGTPSVIPALWVEAVNALGMRGPDITTAPPGDGGALVNLPVWLWTQTGGNVWPAAPLQATAEAAAVGQRVDAFAEPLRIDWDMGDGDVVECPGPGDEWQAGDNFLAPGDCHHIYHRSSRQLPDGTYVVTAITTWRVWWFINGAEDGEIELQVGSTTDYQVSEIQVLTGRR